MPSTPARAVAAGVALAVVVAVPAYAATSHDDASALSHIAAAQAELSAAAAAITAPAPTVTVTQTVTVTAAPATTTPAPTTTSATPTSSPAGVKPVTYWQSLFDGQEASFWSENQSLSTSTDEWDIYDLAYGIDGYTAMWRATGQTRYLDRALTLVENKMAKAVLSSSLSGSQFKDSYLTWPNQSTAGGGTIGQEYPLFESYGWRYVTQLLASMRDAGLDTSTAYGARWAKILAFTERNIFDKWYSRGTANLYRNRTHMASHWAYIALELRDLTADATRRARCQTVLDNIDHAGMAAYSGASLRGQMRDNPADPGAYWWASVWGSTSRPGQDVDHGNAVLAYVVEAHDRGYGWTDTDMTRFSRTLAVIDAKKQYVDGTGTDTGWIPDGFVKLGRYSPTVQQRLEAHTTQSQGQYRANMALNARLLGAR